MSVAKVHTSSVAVVPPATVWRSIQSLRCFADKSFVRWPPHINLLYPFHPDGPQVPELSGAAKGEESDSGHHSGGRQRSGANRSSGGLGRSGARRSGPGRAVSAATAANASLAAVVTTWDAPRGDVAGELQLTHASAGSSGGLVEDPFGQLAARAGRALARVEPFTVRLAELRVFRHSARSITVWADPIAVPHPNTAAATAAAADGGAQAEPAAPVGLVAVQALLEAEFPACTDLSADEGRGIRGFVPHLSLGQLRDERELEALQAAWKPLEWVVDSVQLISRRGYLSPFIVRYHVPFGLDAEGLGPGTAAASRSAGRSLVRAVWQLDVPYVATVANLHPRAGQLQEKKEERQEVVEPANGDDTQSLVQRFAMPCLVLPTRPPQPACSTLQQTSEGSGAPPPCTAAAGVAMERCAGTNGVARVQAATAVGYVPVEAGTAGSDHLADMPRASAAAGAGVAAESSPGDGLGARAEEPSVWWFAYGAALQASPGELGALESHPAVLAGRSYRLAFNRPGGRANLAPTRDLGSDPGLQAVHGVLHRLPLEAMARLLLVVHEACPTEVTCVPYGCEPATANRSTAAAPAELGPGPAPVTAMAFVAPPELCLPQEAQPHPGYLQALLDSCRSYSLDSSFCDWVQAALQAAPGAAQPASRAPPVVAGLPGVEGLDVSAGGGSSGEGAGAQQRQWQTQRLGREPQRSQNKRTGAKKAAAGLPRGATDW